MEGWLGIIVLQLLIMFAKGVQFTLTPQNTILHQPAMYQCTVDTDGVSITWTVNGTISTSSSIISLGIVTQGAATHNSTLTIPGEDTLNETVVRCIASGFINGEGYFNTSSAVLYIQGPPATVIDLSCTLTTLYSVHCNWTAPFTISGVEISKYNVNVTNHNEALVKQSVIYNHFTYNVSEFGSYNFSVAAVIGDEDLVGDIIMENFIVEEVQISNCSIKVHIENGLWIVMFMITDYFLSTIPPIGVYVCLSSLSDVSDTCTSNRTGSIMQIIVPLITGEISLKPSDNNKKLKVSIILTWDTLLEVHCNEYYYINTFDVQAGTVKTNPDEVCFTCVFTDGSQAMGCYIELSSVTVAEYGTFLTVLMAESKKCVTNLKTDVYDISFYDYEMDGSICKATPAFQLNNISLMTSVNIMTPQMFSVFSSAMVSFSPPTTCICSIQTTCIATESLLKVKDFTDAKEMYNVGVIVGLSILCVILLVVTVSSVTGLLTMKKRNENSHPKKVDADLVNAVSFPVSSNPCYETTGIKPVQTLKHGPKSKTLYEHVN